jgi:hypothetical protein
MSALRVILERHGIPGAPAHHASRLTGPFTESGQITCQNRPDRSRVSNTRSDRFLLRPASSPSLSSITAV